MVGVMGSSCELRTQASDAAGMLSTFTEVAKRIRLTNYLFLAAYILYTHMMTQRRKVMRSLKANSGKTQ